MVQQSPIQWHFWHVKGHQVDFIGPLAKWAAMNVQVDRIAKEHWMYGQENQILPNHNIAYEPWSVWKGKHKIVSPIQEKIYCHVHDPK